MKEIHADPKAFIQRETVNRLSRRPEYEYLSPTKLAVQNEPMPEFYLQKSERKPIIQEIVMDFDQSPNKNSEESKDEENSCQLLMSGKISNEIIAQEEQVV